MPSLEMHCGTSAAQRSLTQLDAAGRSAAQRNTAEHSDATRSAAID